MPNFIKIWLILNFVFSKMKIDKQKGEKRMNAITLFFTALNEKAVVPSKRPEDAGYDIYACFEEETIEIRPHQTVLISTGVASAFPMEVVAILKERSSTGVRGIGVRAGVIDSGYRGEWKVPLTNHNQKTLYLTKTVDEVVENETGIYYPYSKAICQALFIELPQTKVETILPEVLREMKSERGEGGFGSSGK